MAPDIEVALGILVALIILAFATYGSIRRAPTMVRRDWPVLDPAAERVLRTYVRFFGVFLLVMGVMFYFFPDDPWETGAAVCAVLGSVVLLFAYFGRVSWLFEW